MNVEQHAIALQRIEHLVALDPAVDTPEGEELDALVDVVMAYEREHYPFPHDPPGERPSAEMVPTIYARRAVERVVRVLEELDETYTMTAALQFLYAPQPLLDQRRPIDLVMSGEGMHEVLAVIRRMHDGVYF